MNVPVSAIGCTHASHPRLRSFPAAVTPLATLPPVLSKHFLSVSTVVGVVAAPFTPVINEREVAAAFHAPLAMFLEDANHWCGSCGSCMAWWCLL